MNPEFYDYLMEKLFAAGALDVYFTPIQMKKNRPAVKLTVLTENDQLEQIADLILRESTSLGVRVLDNIQRFCLERKIKELETPWGTARIKLALKDGEVINAAPEYEDCKKIADKEGIPLKKIFHQINEIFDNTSILEK